MPDNHRSLAFGPRRLLRHLSLTGALAGVLLGIIAAASPQIRAEARAATTELATLDVTTLAGGLAHPWGLAFLPDGHMLVTERPGRLRLVTPGGAVSAPIAGVPQVAARGQGGLLDVVLAPDYAESGTIFLSFAEPGPGGAGTAVARARLDRAAMTLRDVAVIFRQAPKSRGGRHFGSRLVFKNDGTLWITIGDRGQRQRVQDFTINRGQVIRVNPDGTIPSDNPFVGIEGQGVEGQAIEGRRPEVWSYGHRNPQGAARHPETGALWIHEHGAQGGDEVNIPEAGKNYGWPVIHYGVDYGGGPIGEGTAKPGLEQPLYYWDPSIAPSGMAFYTADKVPAWRGDLFIGALKFRLLVRLGVEDGRIVHEERMLDTLGERIRAVEQGPGGDLYLLTDAPDGRILRVTPTPK